MYAVFFSENSRKLLRRDHHHNYLWMTKTFGFHIVSLQSNKVDYHTCPNICLSCGGSPNKKRPAVMQATWTWALAGEPHGWRGRILRATWGPPSRPPPVLFVSATPPGMCRSAPLVVFRKDLICLALLALVPDPLWEHVSGSWNWQKLLFTIVLIHNFSKMY